MSFHDVCLFSLGAAFGASGGAFLREARGVAQGIEYRWRARRATARANRCLHAETVRLLVTDVVPDTSLAPDEWMRECVYVKCAACDAEGGDGRWWVPSATSIRAYRPSEWNGARGEVRGTIWVLEEQQRGK